MKNFDKLIQEQLAKDPTDISKLSPDMRDNELLRTAISAELDAINLYEQMASTTTNADLKETFLDIAKEEKVHVGEFETLLKQYDSEHEEAMIQGRNEVETEKGE